MKTIVAVVSLIMILSSFRDNSNAFEDESPSHSEDKRVVELINHTRAKGMKCGNKHYKPTQPVKWSETLGKASLMHSLDMARREILCHTNYDGSMAGDRLSKLSYKWSAYGENVGEGYLTPEDVVNGWLKSPKHCENIMNPVFKEAGSSYARRSRKIYWTLMLAAPGKGLLIDR